MYVFCLPHEVVCTDGGCAGGWTGFVVAVFGWAEIFGIGRASLVVVLSWFANPAIWVAWGLLLGRVHSGAASAALVAMLLALGYRAGTHILVSESGSPDTISGVGPGYWAWVLSMGLALVAGLIGSMRPAEERPQGVDRHRLTRGRPSKADDGRRNGSKADRQRH
jgi:hypothetical protein